ncbi:hypothetical protein CI1B_12110 [Bradyrhizobium ivorense]|uniref:Nuclear transport factor 2 family protein n=1 Tax=Bradyrhizobium ivorense TaxID=2511166 RepID=A0A508SU22_9BRAD|nr:nuclear transport factor 2 family protein [Bradyrhizobium ivorense]MCC8938249.1 nuclear transport factor 2 family protein [Bradyrhizobium ivorense]VIO66099.1 hypothetical protein CI1B_12110 [Bradyrhizobium ivorense]VIO80381.1 hypothetical protein CI41S_72520 [Bradyrhizobium ivorense]
MESNIKDLFDAYERFFGRALAGEAAMGEAESFYAAEFIAASPNGVMTGKNDARLRQVMAEGYARYRSIGTKAMQIRHLRISPIDEQHCVTHVAWRASYTRKGLPDVTIDFEVHYLVQQLGTQAKIFGWVSGDEQAVLQQHGII